MLINIILFASLNILNIKGLLTTILCYNIFAVIGYLYYKQISYRRILICAVVSLLLLIGVLCLTSTDFIPLQDHKFPPDMVFLLYNIFVLCICGCIIGRINLKGNKLLDIWNERGYTIYLYQNFVLYALQVLKNKFLISVPSVFLQCILCFAFSLIASTALSYITYPFERKVMKFLRAI